MFWKAGADATMLPKPTTAPNTRADVAAAPALSANKLLNIAASEFPRYLRFNTRQMMNAKAIPRQESSVALEINFVKLPMTIKATRKIRGRKEDTVPGSSSLDFNSPFTGLFQFLSQPSSLPAATRAISFL